MTNSETKFRNSLKKLYPTAYIKKIPDFKQTGNSALRGLPDYLMINNGNHRWLELKMVKSKQMFKFSEIRDAQWIEFKALLDAGVNVEIWVYDGNNNLHLFNFSSILEHLMQGKKYILFV